MSIRQGSSWCDVFTAPWGVGFAHTRGVSVVCEHADGGSERWARGTGQPLLYLRAAADAGGHVCVIGQGHHDGQAWASVDGGPVFPLGPTHGVFPVLVRGLEEGWECFLQDAPASYTRLTLDRDGWVVDRHQFHMPPTSQGFLYVTADGTPITQDAGRGAIPGLALPSPAPSDSRVWAGQSTSAATIALFDRSTGHLTPLGTPGGQPPHIVEKGSTFYVCSYVDGGAWLSTHRRPFAAPPIDPDPVDPDPPKETPVQLEPKHSQVIQAFADQFGLPGFSKEEGQAWVAKLASTMKARFPADNWGTKRASNSRPLSNESIARPANGRLWGYDLIIGAGAPGQRLEPRAHAEDITDQVFVSVESRDWLTGGGGNNPPPPPPPPTGFTFPTGVEMPEDVALSVIDGYLEGIRERDKVRAQDTVPSRGALMYLFAVFFRELSTWIVEKKRAPIGVEWWGVRDRIVAAAVKHYQDRQGVD